VALFVQFLSAAVAVEHNCLVLAPHLARVDS
jgi:hypothetical protein